MLGKGGYPLTPGVSAEPLDPGFVFSGYLQAQFETHQDSEDQVLQGGGLMNQDRFLLRRGRFRVTRDWEYTQVVLELDGNTNRGPSMRIQKAEGSLIYGRSKDKDQPPLLQFTLGQFDLPFGFEVPYSAKSRWFMERSQASRALFPGEPDVGGRISGGVSFARYSMSLTNGEPIDEKSGLALQDPNANKDITGRFGAEVKITPSFVVAGGVSYNRGKGLAIGNDALKGGLSLQDKNANGVADPGDTVASTSSAATRSKTFERWAVGADLELLLRTGLGWSMLHGELVAASNLDRGLFIANPVNPADGSTTNYRELGYYVAFTQEITPYGVVGFRADFYDPNADSTDSRVGKLLPFDQKLRTLSPLAGLVLPGRARLLLQYDVIKDFLARDTRGVPTDRENNQWTLRMQVNL